MRGIVIRKKMFSRKFQRKVMFFAALLVCFTILFSLFALPAYAKGEGEGEGEGEEETGPITIPSDDELKGADKMHKVIGWLAGWAGKIGLVVAFFGALQTVLGFMNDDADSKVRGLKTMAAGFMLWGISMSVNIFFTA
jgi:hypothetical protein